MDLNVDCQLLIFEHLDVTSLLALAQLNLYFHGLASNVFKRKYSCKIVELNTQMDESSLISTVDISEQFPNKLIIGKFDVISIFFEYFGHMVQAVDILKYKIWDEQKNLKEIVKIVNNNSNSLKVLKLENTVEDILNSVAQPFRSIKRLDLSGVFDKLGSESMDLNEMFPNIQEIYLSTRHVADDENMAVKLPNLKHLRLGFDPPVSSIEKLIKQNPQIERLTISGISINALFCFNQNLPNLTHLIVHYITLYDKNIHFRNVKHLKINTLEYKFALHATFTHLKKLELDVSTRHVPDEWINFIKKYDNLKELHVLQEELSDREFKFITEKLKKLIEASFHILPDVEENTIITFLERNKQLKKLNLLYLESEQMIEMFNALKANIGNDWNLSINKKYCLLERKINL